MFWTIFLSVFFGVLLALAVYRYTQQVLKERRQRQNLEAMEGLHILLFGKPSGRL
jgi:uncharacterized membrane protein